MPELQITICGQSTSIACSEEDETRLRHLISLVEGRADSARAIVGDNDRWRQLLFAAIFLADELDSAPAEADSLPAVNANSASAVDDAASQVMDFTRRIGASLDRIEAAIAGPLEQRQANA